MPAVVVLLRGVNVGGRGMLPMARLRELCHGLGLKDVATYVQSGNVVCRAKSTAKLAPRLEDAIEEEFGFRPPVILRSAAEMRSVVDRNPFAGRAGLVPGYLNVTFLSTDPGDAARAAARQIPVAPEEMYLDGREIYTYFSSGMGKTKLPFKKLERALGQAGTARNWNSVMTLTEMAEALDSAR